MVLNKHMNNTTRIPKIIHYCWFGRKPLPKLAQKCIQSWQKHLPDYQFILWNEDNYDLSQNRFAQEAYDHKKFAFVTDVVRLDVLHRFGGIYMDTDVEVLGNLDSFLHLPAFSGFETEDRVPTGIMASEPEGAWVEELLAYYVNRSFLKTDGKMETTTNTEIISQHMLDQGFVLQNGLQQYKGIATFYPKDVFCPKEPNGKLQLTENSICIHHFNGSWLSPIQKIKRFIITHIVGKKLTGKWALIKGNWKNRFPRKEQKPSFTFSGLDLKR